MDEKMTMDQRIQSAKDWCSDKWRRTKDWCYNHKEMIVVFGPVAIGSVIECVKVVTKRSNVKEEKRLKENYIYDRSNGHYVELRRKPKQREWIQIDQRRANGENLAQILMDMRLLK